MIPTRVSLSLSELLPLLGGKFESKEERDGSDKEMIPLQNGVQRVFPGAWSKIRIMINFGGIALIPLGRGRGRRGEQRTFHFSMSLLRSEVCPSSSSIAEASMFQRQLILVAPFSLQMLRAEGACGSRGH